MDQEEIMKANFLNQEIEQLESNISAINQQMAELHSFSDNLLSLNNSEGKEMFSSLGKGVFLKTSVLEQNLYVNIGANIIVKKTPKETKDIIEDNISKLSEAKVHLSMQLEEYTQALTQIISNLESKSKKS